MKYYVLIVISILNFLFANAELTKDEMKQLRGVRMGGIRVGKWRNDDRKEFSVLEISTSQDEDNPLLFDMTRFQMRLVVELTDKEKNKHIIKFIGNLPGDYDSEYKGEDYWKFYMDNGDLGRPKISGYAIQYGIMEGENFVVLAEQEKDSDRVMEGLNARTTLLFEGNYYMRHYYIYDDVTLGTTESSPRNIREVKE